MVALDPVVGVLAGVVERVWYQLLDHRLKSWRQVIHHLLGAAMGGDRLGEEPARRGEIPAGRDAYVDDLAVLVEGPVDGAPPAGDQARGQWPMSWWPGVMRPLS